VIKADVDEAEVCTSFYLDNISKNN